MNGQKSLNRFFPPAGKSVFLAALFILAGVAARSGETPSEKLDVIRRIIGDRGEYDLAESQLKTFIEENRARPVSAEALVLLGYCQDKQKKSRDAAASYQRALTEYPGAPAALRADAAMGAADAFYRLGEYGEAVANYSAVLDSSEKPDHKEAALLWRAEANYRKGMEEKGGGGDGKAWLAASADDFVSFIDIHPDSKSLPSALYGAAFASFDDADYEKALVFLNRFVDAFPADRRTEETRYYIGESLFRLDRFDEARHAFSRVVAEHPGGRLAPDARSGMAWADHGLGRVAEAAAGFEEAAKLAGDDRDLALSCLYDAGCAWREAGDPDKAAAALQEVAKAGDHELNGLAWFRLGTLWQERAKQARDRAAAAAGSADRDKFDSLRRQMGEDAIAYFRKALESGKLGAEEVEARSIMGEVLLDANRYPEAVDAFAEIARRWPDSPRAAWALYHEALAHRELAGAAQSAPEREDRLIKAAQALRRSLEYPQAKVRLQAAWALADYLGELGENDEAREWRRWLSSEGENWAKNWKDPSGRGDSSLEARAGEYAADSLFQLAEGCYFGSDLPRAAGYYQEIIAKYPDASQAAMSYLRLGEIAENGKDAENAAKRYEEALRIGGNLPRAQVAAAMGYARLRLGVLRLREGQRAADPAVKRDKLQEALRCLNAAQADVPDGMNVSRLHYYLAEAKYSLGLKQESVKDYEESLRGEPKGELSDAAWFGLAWARRDLKDLAGALEACRRVIDDFPSSQLRPEALILAAAVSREASDPLTALRDLDVFLADYPAQDLAPKAELERASALDELGRHDESAAAFRKFLDDNPDHPDTPQALYQLSWALWNKIKPDVAAARDAEREWKSLTGGAEAEELPEGERARALEAKDRMQRTAAAVRTSEDGILASLRELTDRYPDYAVADAAWLRIGEILYDRGDFQQAHNAYKKALSIAEAKKSDLGDKAQYRLAWSVQRLAESAERAWRAPGDTEKREAARNDMWDKRLSAVNAFETMLGKYPNSDLYGEACFRAAELRRRSGQDTLDESKRSGWYSTAAERYRQALEKGGKDASYRRAAEYGLALSLLLDRKYPAARERFQKFLSDYADGEYTQESYWGLGTANLEMGAYAEAGAAFEHALSLDKGTETAAKSRYGLGLTAVQAGDRERARIEFLAVDAIYPNYPEWAAVALVRAARTALQDGFREKAIGDLERVLARYPETAAAGEAKSLQAELSAL